jgi:hypothetical protein
MRRVQLCRVKGEAPPPLSPPPRPPLPPPSAASRMDESLPTTLQLTKRRRSFKISASAATSSV